MSGETYKICKAVLKGSSSSAVSANPALAGMAGQQSWADLKKQIGHPEADAKTEWPELVGKDADGAKAVLEEETGKKVYLVKSGSMVTMDYRTDRIRVFYDAETGLVTKPPKVG